MLMWETPEQTTLVGELVKIKSIIVEEKLETRVGSLISC
jgi:hypothetical protein